MDETSVGGGFFGGDGEIGPEVVCTLVGDRTLRWPE